MTAALSAEATIAQWFTHTLSIRRLTGRTSSSRTFAAAEPITGVYSDRTEYSGGEIIAQGRFAFPRAVDYVPVQSEVTLPAEFGGRVATVVFVEVGDGAGQATPDHQVIGVL